MEYYERPAPTPSDDPPEDFSEFREFSIEAWEEATLILHRMGIQVVPISHQDVMEICSDMITIFRDPTPEEAYEIAGNTAQNILEEVKGYIEEAVFEWHLEESKRGQRQR